MFIADVLLSHVLFLSFCMSLSARACNLCGKLSGLQAGGIRFEFGPEICIVFCLVRYNLLVCKLAEKASFHILTCTPFTDIFFSIWWCMIVFCASEAAGKLACVFTRMRKHTNRWTLLAFDVWNLHCFCGKHPEYRMQVEEYIFPRESYLCGAGFNGTVLRDEMTEQEAERGLGLVWSCLLCEHTQTL